jgi:LPXTG-motif cell wall-anchored protein
MAAIRRVPSSSCRGFIVVLLAAFVGLAMPMSAIADPSQSPDPAPAVALTLACDQPEGTLVWADDEIGYEVVGANSGDAALAAVTVTDDLAGVLKAATLDADPVATITHGDGSTESASTSLNGTHLTWAGALDPGDTIRLSYTVTVGLVAKSTTLHNVAAATWVGADGSMQATATAETSNPVNPVAIAGAHTGSKAGAGKKLANTGVEASGMLALAGLLLAFGMALVAVRRRD